jgi:hypothetical protein
MNISLSGSSAFARPEQPPPPAIEQYNNRAQVHYKRTIMRSVETKERMEKQRQGVVRGLRSAKCVQRPRSSRLLSASDSSSLVHRMCCL